MSTEQPAQGTTPEPPRPEPDGGASEERAIRDLAIRQAERVHGFKIHVVMFLIGIVLIGVIWMLTEYFQDSTWPSRFADSDDGDPTVWNPWYFYAVGVWAIILAVHGAKTYGRRPPSEAEIQREIDRIKSAR
jgi:hypothetical protein